MSRDQFVDLQEALTAAVDALPVGAGVAGASAPTPGWPSDRATPDAVRDMQGSFLRLKQSVALGQAAFAYIPVGAKTNATYGIEVRPKLLSRVFWSPQLFDEHVEGILYRAITLTPSTGTAQPGASGDYTGAVFPGQIGDFTIDSAPDEARLRLRFASGHVISDKTVDQVIDLAMQGASWQKWVPRAAARVALSCPGTLNDLFVGLTKMTMAATVPPAAFDAPQRAAFLLAHAMQGELLDFYNVDAERSTETVEELLGPVVDVLGVLAKRPGRSSRARAAIAELVRAGAGGADVLAQHLQSAEAVAAVRVAVAFVNAVSIRLDFLAARSEAAMEFGMAGGISATQPLPFDPAWVAPMTAACQAAVDSGIMSPADALGVALQEGRHFHLPLAAGSAPPAVAAVQAPAPAPLAPPPGPNLGGPPSARCSARGRSGPCCNGSSGIGRRRQYGGRRSGRGRTRGSPGGGSNRTGSPRRVRYAGAPTTRSAVDAYSRGDNRRPRSGSGNSGQRVVQDRRPGGTAADGAEAGGSG